MNAFESVIAMLLDREGYWVKPTFKVQLTKGEKKRIGSPPCPRWELDLIAYKASTNTVLVVECKSYLDSRGVTSTGFIGDKESVKKRYKLFNEKILRETVFERLAIQLRGLGLVSGEPKIKLCLAAGNIASENDRKLITQHFHEQSWLLFDDVWMRDKLRKISESRYENDVTSIVSKILLRD